MVQIKKKLTVMRGKIFPLGRVKLLDLPKFCLVKLAYDYATANLFSETIQNRMQEIWSPLNLVVHK